MNRRSSSRRVCQSGAISLAASRTPRRGLRSGHHGGRVALGEGLLRVARLWVAGRVGRGEEAGAEEIVDRRSAALVPDEGLCAARGALGPAALRRLRRTVVALRQLLFEVGVGAPEV